MSEAQAKQNIQAFWGDVCRQWYAENDARLTTDELARQLDAVEAYFKRRGQLAVVEMPYEHLAGQRVLEIGSGGGAHSCLFKRKGAVVTAVDITPERVASTKLKLDLLPGESEAMQADAEHLPFPDNSFDIVYSNGVLHHSADTDRCIEEVFRVLKPGGLAVIMLYARHSSMYWLNILPRAILDGGVFHLPEAEWIGRITEGTPKFGATRNPYTRVYSKRQLGQLFHRFKNTAFRKNSFRLDYLPIPKGDKLRIRLLRLLGGEDSPAGAILYGQPLLEDCAMELALSPYIGWCWNISARKP